LPGKAVPEMTNNVSGETLNPTHSLTDSYQVMMHSVADSRGAARCILKQAKIVHKNAFFA